MSLSSQVITSSWAECSPVTVSTTETIYTTVWTTNLLAANEFSKWEAVYTITEVRTGDPAEYRRPEFPPCFVETSVHCGRCAEEQDIVITAPAPTMTEDVTIDGDGVVASALGLPADDLPAPTEAPAGVEEHAGEEFPPTEPQDVQPEIAGGAEVPPGAAPFPDDAEFRGEEVEATTIQSALNLSPEATGEVDPDVTITDTLVLSPTDVAAPLTAADALGLAPEVSGEPEADQTVASALNLAPEASGEARTQSDLADDAGIETETETGTETIEDIAADALGLPAEVSDEAEADPALTVEDILPLLSGTTPLPEATGDSQLRGGSGSDILNEEQALSNELQDELSTTFATMTVEGFQSLSTVLVPSASESASFRTSSDPSDETEEEEEPSNFSGDGASDSGSGPAPGTPEEDGFVVTAAAARTPTQSTTLLAVNALIVGLWVLL